MKISLKKLLPAYSPLAYSLGLILLMLIITATSYTIIYWQNQDHLIQFVPRDAKAYIHLNYSRNVPAGSKINKVFDLFFSETTNYFFSNTKNKPDLKNQTLQEASLFLNKNNDWVAILQLKDPQRPPVIFENQPDTLLLKNYLIIAKNPDAIQQILETLKNPELSLKNSLTLDFEADVLEIYLTSQNLSNFTASQKDNYFLTNLLDNYLAKQKISYFSFSFDKNLAFSLRTDGQLKAEDNLLLTSLPPDSIATFIVNSLNPQTSLLTNYLDPKDQPFIKKLLAGPTQIIITKNKTAALKYLIVVRPIGRLNIKGLEEALKSVSAKLFPTPTKKILPDKSSVIELLANPQDFYWENGDLNIKTIKTNHQAWNLSYVYNNDLLIISNSQENLKNVLQGTNVINLTASCQSSNLPNAFLKPWELLNTKFSSKFKQIFNNLSVESEISSISGCLN